MDKIKKIILIGIPMSICNFCYAGSWSAYVNMATGESTQCYCGKSLGDVFANPDKPFPASYIGKCPIAHCYNGHALMTLGLIPGKQTPGYGDIRNRKRADGSQWLQPELLAFFNAKLEDSNKPLPLIKRILHNTFQHK